MKRMTRRYCVTVLTSSKENFDVGKTVRTFAQEPAKLCAILGVITMFNL